MRRLLHLSLCLLLCGAVRAVAEADCRTLTDHTGRSLATYEFDTSGGLEELPEERPYRLGDIEVVRQNVFEREGNWLHRLANRYHVITQDDVVRSILPIRSGEPVDRRRLAEAERILRSKVYLYDARVIPKQLCGDVLDVFVVTRDVWTLMPEFSLSRTGSENEVGFGVSENNLLGSGKSVSLGYEKDKDRRGIAFAFGDPNIGGSRWALDLAVVDNDDGESAALALEYPFYELDSRRALGVSVQHEQRDEGLWFLGDEVFEYEQDHRRFRLTAGWSPGLEGRFVNRFLLGYAHEDYNFDLPDELTLQFPGTESPNREYSYPFVAFQRIEDEFDTGVNIDRVQRTEDLALGLQLLVELGYSPPTAGDGEHLIARVDYSDATWVNEYHLLAFRAWLDGYYDLDRHRSENLATGATVSYRYQQKGSWSLLVQASAEAIKNPTLDRQLLLGGEVGLRGYPNRYQTGDRRFLLTIEERYYSNLYPLRMFRLGAAAFIDVGRAWYEAATPEWLPDDRSGGHFDVLANAGLGLRLESTRTRRDQIVHLDVAFPVRGGPNVRDVEITLTAKQSL
ncbi:MAG TPA: hypothetical protein VF210_05295 [Pseudomonadales bacterium]